MLEYLTYQAECEESHTTHTDMEKTFLDIKWSQIKSYYIFQYYMSWYIKKLNASFQTTNIRVCMNKYVFYLPLSWEDQQQGQQAKSNLGHKHDSQRPIMSKKKDLQKEPGHRSLVRQNLQISTLFVM